MKKEGNYMPKPIIYKGKQYLLDTKEAKKEFYADLTETMDDSLLIYLGYINYKLSIEKFLKIRIINVLRKIEMEKESALYSMRMSCENLYRMLQHPPVFMVLYSMRRELYDKYLLKLTEKTALEIAIRAIENYKSTHEGTRSMNYPMPYIRKGELFILKDQLEELNSENQEDTPQ